MKYVLLAALLATLSPAQAGDTDKEVDCATRAYVGVCQEDDPVGMVEGKVFIEPQTKDPEADCSAYPYAGICDMETES